jgi:hypothetical protein
VTRYVDGPGVAKALINGTAGLTGKGAPLANGVVLSEVRSSSQGAIATVAEIPPRVTWDAYDDVRLSFTVSSVGSEEGARGQAELAARSLAETLLGLQNGPPVTVTTRRGDVVVVRTTHSLEGPTLAGDIRGRLTYRVDATLRCQPQ